MGSADGICIVCFGDQFSFELSNFTLTLVFYISFLGVRLLLPPPKNHLKTQQSEDFHPLPLPPSDVQAGPLRQGRQFTGTLQQLSQLAASDLLPGTLFGFG